MHAYKTTAVTVYNQSTYSKIFIAKKEAAETKYWLKILIELGDKSEEIMYLQEETQGILMTLQKIISTLKAKSENGER